MKRNREKQNDACPRPGGKTPRRGGGGGGPVLGDTANITTSASSTTTVAPVAHTAAGGGTTALNVTLGAGNMATTSSIDHQQTLSPQPDGAQAIEYLPATTPVTATNLISGAVIDSNAGGNNDRNTGSYGASGSGNSVVTSFGGRPGFGNAYTYVQMQTSYNLSSLSTRGTIQTWSAPFASNAIVAQTSNYVRPRTKEVATQTSTSAYVSQPVIDARNFTNRVILNFSNKPHLVFIFRYILNQFKGNRIDVAGLKERIHTLLEGHPALINEFNALLPHLECNERSVHATAGHTPTHASHATASSAPIQVRFDAVLPIMPQNNAPDREHSAAAGIASTASGRVAARPPTHYSPNGTDPQPEAQDHRHQQNMPHAHPSP